MALFAGSWSEASPNFTGEKKLVFDSVVQAELIIHDRESARECVYECKGCMIISVI